MKILHVINNLGSGGAEKLLTDILPKFKEQGHEVELCISNGKKNVNTYNTILKESEIRIIDFRTSFYNPLIVFKLLKVIKKGDYNIIHAHLFPSQYWLAFASIFFSKKIILLKTEHSVFNERKHYKILRPLEKFVYKQYDRIIGITEKVKENLEEWLGRDDVIVIKNGVNLSQIEDAKQLQESPTDIDLKKEEFSILMTGRFDGWQKDQKSLIDAVELIDQNIQLYFAGTGSYMSELKEAIKTYKTRSNIHFLGMRTDVYAIMSSVNLNVLSTNHEGLSGVALESLASGRPFIGSDVEGVKDVVPDNSFLFPKQNPEKLAEKILEIKNNPIFEKSLIDKGLEHVKQYDTSVMVANYLALYDEVNT